MLGAEKCSVDSSGLRAPCAAVSSAALLSAGEVWEQHNAHASRGSSVVVCPGELPMSGRCPGSHCVFGCTAPCTVQRAGQKWFGLIYALLITFKK